MSAVRQHIAAEVEMRRGLKVGDPFHGKHRAARVQKWQAANRTAAAAKKKKAARRAQAKGRKAAR